MVRVGVVGGRGYIGGEVLRLLVQHPGVEISCVVSRSKAGEYIHKVHPNLKAFLNMRFSDFNLSRIGDSCDVVILAIPHGVGVELPQKLMEMGLKVIDLSANYRLKNPSLYEKYYGFKHPYPNLLEKAVYGLPELHRDEIRNAQLVSCPGCIATAGILALTPIVKELEIDGSSFFAHAMIGSTAAGSTPTIYTHHPERVNIVRPYKLTGHRHIAEIEQELGIFKPGVKVFLSAYAVDMVRGIMFSCQVPVDNLSDRDVWRIYRGTYRGEPFIILLKDQRSLFRLPDPKIAVGTNFCYIGFENSDDGLVVVSALDNLVKGGAGNAVQCLNLMFGFDEKTSLYYPGLHPV